MPPTWRRGPAGLSVQKGRTAAGIILAFVLVAVALAPSPVRAQDGDGQQVIETAGPYEIGITTIPSNLTLGRVQFTITVLDAATRQPVSDARVRIWTAREGDQRRWSLALNHPATPERYQSKVTLDDPGIWNVDVEVSSPLGDVLVAAPVVEIFETRPLTGGSFVFMGVFLVLILGAVYLWRSARRQRAKRAASLASQGQPEEVHQRVEPDSGPTGPDASS